MASIIENSASLLIAVAASDGDFEEKEKKQVIKALIELFGISASESEALLGRTQIKNSNLINQAANQLKNETSKKQIKKLLSLLWAVSLSDGSRDLPEEQLIDELAERLGISSLDNNLAKIIATHV
ncbi:MAG: hypothetical protein CML56_05655 [Rhodobacteraceae bacterium]|nr:hypothetical protein [Paracoccaceae bacterium]|tara:strand:+ start:114 stop:491 length:378 start_codon:yes stop_codon:yes gene_type:complete